MHDGAQSACWELFAFYVAAIGSPKRLDGCQGQHRMASGSHSRVEAAASRRKMHHVSFNVFVAEGLGHRDVGAIPRVLQNPNSLKTSRRAHSLLGSSHGPVLQLVQQASLLDLILIAAAVIFARTRRAGQAAGP